jgi:hypothetical protein
MSTTLPNVVHFEATDWGSDGWDYDMIWTVKFSDEQVFETQDSMEFGMVSDIMNHYHVKANAVADVLVQFVETHYDHRNEPGAPFKTNWKKDELISHLMSLRSL